MMNKTDLLFQMMEHPHAYTDQQWQEILMDEECRELYTLMAKTKSAFDSQKEVDDETIDAEWSRLTTNPSRCSVDQHPRAADYASGETHKSQTNNYKSER